MNKDLLHVNIEGIDINKENATKNTNNQRLNRHNRDLVRTIIKTNFKD